MLAEHSGRTAHPVEADLPEGKATDEAARDMEVSRMLETLPALSPAELRSEWRRAFIEPSRHGSVGTCSFARSPTASRSFAMVGSAKRPDGSSPRS